VTFPWIPPTIRKATPVRIPEYRNWFCCIWGINLARMKLIRGIMPIARKDRKVIRAVLLGSLRWGLCLLVNRSFSDFVDR